MGLVNGYKAMIYLKYHNRISAVMYCWLYHFVIDLLPEVSGAVCQQESNYYRHQQREHAEHDC